MSTLAAVLLTLPWLVPTVATPIRMRRSRSLADFSADPLPVAPRVSIVIPARNEATNIERCVRSVLRSAYPELEVIAVDDHSTDDTGKILVSIAAGDSRLRIVVPRALPSDWFGKQWACTAGFDASTGEMIGFLDADTWQEPDLIARLIRAMDADRADLMTVGGRQELGGFWEKLLQPQVFSMMAIRYGGTEAVNTSARVSDKIANGQCLFVRRDAYVELGGHGAVRDKVAEDLALAQRFFLAGKRTILIMGRDQLSTRMYTSLPEIVNGWGKNIYAGGRDAMPLGRIGRLLFPLALPLPALMQIVPLVVLLSGLGGAWLVWSAMVVAVNAVWWVIVYSYLRLPPLYAVLHPAGALVFLYIALSSILRGDRVRWKGREYISA